MTDLRPDPIRRPIRTIERTAKVSQMSGHRYQPLNRVLTLVVAQHLALAITVDLAQHHAGN
jgi:hypothetical protein